MFNLFGQKKSQNLKKKSQKIFDVFTNTQNQCEKVNTEITVLTNNKRAAAAKILEEIESLDEVATKNDVLAKRVQKFINGDSETPTV